MTKPTSSADVHSFMTTLAHGVTLMAKEMGVKDMHFALLCWDFSDGVQYIGNSRREDIAEALQEAATRLKTRDGLEERSDHGQEEDADQGAGQRGEGCHEDQKAPGA